MKSLKLQRDAGIRALHGDTSTPLDKPRQVESKTTEFSIDPCVLFQLLTAPHDNKRFYACMLGDVKPAMIWMCRIAISGAVQSLFLITPGDDTNGKGVLTHGAPDQAAYSDSDRQVRLNVPSSNGNRIIVRLLKFVLADFTWLEKTLGCTYVEKDLESWRPAAEE